jgi:hypothetical protein
LGERIEEVEIKINQKLRSASEKLIPFAEETVVAGDNVYLLSASMSISEPAR